LEAEVVSGAPTDNPFGESPEFTQAQVDELLALEEKLLGRLPPNEHNQRLRRRLEQILGGLLDKVKQGKLNKNLISVKFKLWFDRLTPKRVVELIMCSMPERAREVLWCEANPHCRSAEPSSTYPGGVEGLGC
jgi:hypothetical protein